jgi:hypothetical protein
MIQPNIGDSDMGGYKRLLDEIHSGKVVTQETIDACKAKADAYAEDEIAGRIIHDPELTIEQKLAKVEARERKLAHKSGMSYEEWMTQAKKFYAIDPVQWTVTSVARSPNTAPQYWGCTDEYDARCRVLQLLRYKFHDHFNKGHDFAYRLP